MFLDEQQLEPTNHALNRVISPQGFVFVFIEERGLRNCFGLWNPNHVPTHYHPTQKLLSRLKSFKPSLICYCHPETDLLILTHTQSPYPTHTGDPLDFEHYH
jgi:hypothetical protein